MQHRNRFKRLSAIQTILDLISDPNPGKRLTSKNCRRKDLKNILTQQEELEKK